MSQILEFTSHVNIRIKTTPFQDNIFLPLKKVSLKYNDRGKTMSHIGRLVITEKLVNTASWFQNFSITSLKIIILVILF